MHSSRVVELVFLICASFTVRATGTEIASAKLTSNFFITCTSRGYVYVISIFSVRGPSPKMLNISRVYPHSLNERIYLSVSFLELNICPLSWSVVMGWIHYDGLWELWLHLYHTSPQTCDSVFVVFLFKWCSKLGRWIGFTLARKWWWESRGILKRKKKIALDIILVTENWKVWYHLKAYDQFDYFWPKKFSAVIPIWAVWPTKHRCFSWYRPDSVF